MPPVVRRFSMLVFVAALAVPAGARAQEVTSDARVHFAAGVNLLRDPARPRYEEAYREFKAAYALSPVSQILGNLGLCAMMLERDSEAIAAYESYLKGMIDLDPKEREQVERDLTTLRVGITRVRLSSNLAGVTIIDQRIRAQTEPITNVYGPIGGPEPTTIGIRQGHHVMTARAPGQREVTWEVDAAGSSSLPHVFEFQTEQPVAGAPPPPAHAAPLPAPPPERPIPPTVWYAAGATGVLAVASAVTGIAALGANASYASANRGATPERASELRGDAQTLNVTTDVLLTTTIVAAGLTTFLYLTRPEKARSATASRSDWWLR